MSRLLRGVSRWTLRRRVTSGLTNLVGISSQVQATDEYVGNCVTSHTEHAGTFAQGTSETEVSEDLSGVFQFFEDNPSQENVDLNLGAETYSISDGQPSFQRALIDSDSDSDFESTETCENEFREKLAEWAIEEKISHKAIASLLTILQKSHPKLPKHPRTLLQTSCKHQVKIIPGGEYYHFGVAKGILSKLHENPTWTFGEDKIINIHINIDGLPIFKNSSTHLWPILGMISKVDKQEPFLIGLFCGKSKPPCVTTYLEDFIQECKCLEQNGLRSAEKEYKVRIAAVVCDAPAKAYVKQVKLYSGYFGCDKCTQEGMWLNKVTYPDTDAALRTDDSFSNKSDEYHHTGDSPLSALSIGMVSQIPLDYMHLCCLGVMRKLLNLWMKGRLEYRISGHIIKQISDRLINFCRFIPSEFARKPRELREVERWKATEFRQFMLYTGPVCLHGQLPDALYNNFLLFHVAMILLVSTTSNFEFCQYADKLLKCFVENFREIYGADQLVYNVHCLSHLAGDVQNHGPLDSFSAFPFENFLGSLKKVIRKPQEVLQQVVRRYSEGYFSKPQQNTECRAFVKHKHNFGPLPASHRLCTQFKRAELNKICIDVKSGDNCFKIGDSIVLVRNILQDDDGNLYVVAEPFRAAKNFFSYPLQSSLLGIFTLSPLYGESFVVPVCQVLNKYVLLPFKQEFVAIPIVHFLS